MPTNRRQLLRGRVGIDVVLTMGQEWELLLGPGGNPSHFRDDDERREGWIAHRDDLLSKTPPGRRCWGWWQYEHPGVSRDPFAQAAQLVGMGAVEDVELRRIEQEWERADRVAHFHADIARRVSGRLFFEALRDERRMRGVPLDRPELDDFDRVPDVRPEN